MTGQGLGTCFFAPDCTCHGIVYNLGTCIVCEIGENCRSRSLTVVSVWRLGRFEVV